MSADTSAPVAAANGLANLSLYPAPGAQPRHEDVQEGTRLVKALTRAMNRPGQGSSKQLIRSTDHTVLLGPEAGTSSSALVQEQADEVDEGSEGEAARPAPEGAPSQHGSTAISGSQRVLTSWKTNEFAYRKVSSVGLGADDELPTLARGLFTERVGPGEEHRIVVRGYDKFFNVGEMPWTKPEAIAGYSTGPYVLSFKENGCIIFIAALTPEQLIVTSKHSLGSRDGEVSHARMGEEWLDKHLARVGRSKKELAQELWRRGETAVAELCDDSFEEHVLAYPPERSGLHLHGLNRNAIHFSTRSMAEVAEFAKAWGMIPTRYLELPTLAEVDAFTARCAETGSYEGEAIEGFVVRTHVARAPGASSGSSSAVAPPYAPGQAWFYKVKFDEPYLMYRDWRELTRKMLGDKVKWEEEGPKGGEAVAAVVDPSPSKPQEASTPAGPTTSEGAPEKSKKQLKKEAKKAATASAKATALAQRGANGSQAPPPPDLPRNKRPETKLYVVWCHEQLYGSADGKVRAKPELFSRFSEGKGIIALRQAFLRFLDTPDGQHRFAALGGESKAASKEEEEARRKAAEERANLPFTHTVIVPVAVPGCGKTALGVALSDLFNLAHTQADNVTNKRTGPQFLKNVASELDKGHRNVFADRNNHLVKHRSEIVDVCRTFENPPPPKGKKGKQGPPALPTTGSQVEKRRVRLVALAWKLDGHSLNAIHRICSDRIVARGTNHQSLRAGEDHEAILWRFLETLEPFGALVEQGEGDVADAHFDQTVWLELEEDLEKSLLRAVEGLTNILGVEKPSQERVTSALEKARGYRAEIQKEAKIVVGKSTAETVPQTRYYGIAVELDVLKILTPLLEGEARRGSERHEQALEMLRSLSKDGRITARPHVTLVHRAALPPSDAEADADVQVEDQIKPHDVPPSDEPPTVLEARRHLSAERAGAQSRWDRYSNLCEPGSPPVDFDLTLDRLAWDGRVMVLGVDHISSEALPDVWEIQGGKGSGGEGEGEEVWRPHVTLGTRNKEIRGVEANGVLRAADEGKGGKMTSSMEDVETVVEVVRFESPIRARGRLAGMH